MRNAEGSNTTLRTVAGRVVAKPRGLSAAALPARNVYDAVLTGLGGR